MQVVNYRSSIIEQNVYNEKSKETVKRLQRLTRSRSKGHAKGTNSMASATTAPFVPNLNLAKVKNKMMKFSSVKHQNEESTRK